MLTVKNTKYIAKNEEINGLNELTFAFLLFHDVFELIPSRMAKKRLDLELKCDFWGLKWFWECLVVFLKVIE
jgi:hypothetical protein